ncbi:hypothetical protein TNCV_4344511 [Trichonephila clavipes]|nr:hypothetical protein TNCV_4344511 [Trichonephila clavipes]
MLRKLEKRNKVQFLPPLKKLPSRNSLTPNSSTPTPTKRTPCSSSLGLMSLSCLAAKRQNCHPKRRKNVITQSWFSHKDFMVTILFGGKET